MKRKTISEDFVTSLVTKLASTLIKSPKGKEITKKLKDSAKDAKSGVQSLKKSGLDVDPSVKDSDLDKMVQDDKLDYSEKEKLGVTPKNKSSKKDDVFYQKVLSKLGIDYNKTDEAMVFLKALASADGGGTKAKYNPFNSTLKNSNSKSINSYNVQSYNSEQSGIAATADTLKSLGDGDIVRILKDSMSASDDPDFVLKNLANRYTSYVKGSKIKGVVNKVLDGQFPSPPLINR
jgi:hypothetical protein